MERKILIVDDDISVRTLFEEIFHDAEYTVEAAESASQALGILKEENIDVIFLDLKLFGMNGIDLCRKIRTTRPISIIYAITGWSTLFDIEECREAGFDDYFTKPITLDTLFKAVADAFEKLDRWMNRYGRVHKEEVRSITEQH
jgi:CheY-like chemotaxis protein